MKVPNFTFLRRREQQTTLHLDFVSVQTIAKKKDLGQCPAILTSLLVKSSYLFSFRLLPPFLFFLFGSVVSTADGFSEYVGRVRRHELWDSCSIYNVDCRDLLEENEETGD